jgi:hypothetical protein
MPDSAKSTKTGALPPHLGTPLRMRLFRFEASEAVRFVFSSTKLTIPCWHQFSSIFHPPLNSSERDRRKTVSAPCRYLPSTPKSDTSTTPDPSSPLPHDSITQRAFTPRLEEWRNRTEGLRDSKPKGPKERTYIHLPPLEETRMGRPNAEAKKQVLFVSTFRMFSE